MKEISQFKTVRSINYFSPVVHADVKHSLYSKALTPEGFSVINENSNNVIYTMQN